MSKCLEGKIALVTGAGRGIGKAIADTLAEAGAEVARVSRSNAPYLCNVSNPEDVDKTVEAILTKHGAIHILVNNAGITKDNLLVRMKNEEWDEVLRTNLFGTFYVSRAVTKTMMRQREGRIINIASVIGLIGNAGQANYAASKAGIIGLTKSMAKELGSRGITVNAIAPGFIETEMTDKIPEKAKADLTNRIPLGSLGTSRDVAEAVCFLASPAARYITGQVLNVDGGMVM